MSLVSGFIITGGLAASLLLSGLELPVSASCGDTSCDPRYFWAGHAPETASISPELAAAQIKRDAVDVAVLNLALDRYALSK